LKGSIHIALSSNEENHAQAAKVKTFYAYDLGEYITTDAGIVVILGK